MEPLRIEQQEGCADARDSTPCRLKFYQSSVFREETNEALLSVIAYNEDIPRGTGLRLTRAQVEELRDYLTEYLQEVR